MPKSLRHNLQRLTARILVAMQLALLLVPIGLPVSAKAAPGKGQIVICTIEGLKLLNLADGSKQDIPSQEQKARHCPLCVLHASAALLVVQTALTAPLMHHGAPLSMQVAEPPLLRISLARGSRGPPVSLA